MARTILVTGANGLLGSKCVEALAQNPDHKVVAVWNRGVNRLISSPPPNISYQQCDLTITEAVSGIFRRERVDAILHTAALLPDLLPRYEERSAAANILSTVNLAAAAKTAGCSHFVYCSSVSVYGRTFSSRPRNENEPPAPEDAYGWSKSAAEQYLQLSCTQGGISGVSLRLSGLHGPGRSSGIFFNIARAAMQRKPIQVGSASVPFQFLHLDDAVAAAQQALIKGGVKAACYTSINVSSAIAPSLYDIAAVALKLTGTTVPIIVNEASTTRYQIMATDLLERWRGWSPHGIEKTLASIFSWIADRGYPERPKV
jgi:UDP-glucose 4-epimerase